MTNISLKVIIAILFISQTYASVAMAVLVIKLANIAKDNDTANKIKIYTLKKISNRLINKKNNSKIYDDIDRKLSNYGYKFYFDEMDPSKYILTKYIIALFGAIVGLIVYGLLGMLAGIILGYFMLDIYVKYRDKKDNIEIDEDIRILLGAIKIQVTANIFIIDSLKECYYEARNKRLKRAIIEFTGDIQAKIDVDEAIDKMNSKFNNKNIESMCYMLKQSIRTGKSANMLEYISKHMVAIQKQLNIRNKAKIEWDRLVATFVVFLAIVIYILISGASEISLNIM